MTTTPDSIQSVVTITPVYNDPVGVRQTVSSLLKQSKKRLTSVVVIDNGSTDDTQDIIRNIYSGSDYFAYFVENDVQGSYAARNTGIKQIRRDVDAIAFVDANETVDNDWLETAIGEMEAQDVDYLGCNVELTLPENTLVGRYNAHTGFPVKQYLEEENYAPTCALLVRREVFEDVGLFDARLISGGDREFGERVHEAGYDQGYAEDAVVYHPARTSFESLAKKNFRVGRGFCQKQRYYPERYGKPGLPPTPSGSGGNSSSAEDEYAPSSLFERFAFAFLSIVMLACRGLGYYYEFVFGEERDDIPAPTTS